jgi:hypothetical protein
MTTPTIPSDLSGPKEKLEYCRAKAAEVFAAAERASTAEIRRDLMSVGDQWAALAVHYERIANRDTGETPQDIKAAIGPR